ncbi:MAG: amidohydrolase [Opitutaceae bacterium]|nr:amidohydrolase [Opitutaceae bacterium]
MRFVHGWRLLILGTAFAGGVLAQTSKDDVLARIDREQAPYTAIMNRIWELAEVGFKETRSSALLQERLKADGFKVEAGVAGMPTAFVAAYGSGRPVIGILAEYDALPGISQEGVPEKKARPGSTAAHACGHHAFGAGSIEAAAAIASWLKATGRPGTLRVYGCPAEEGGSGKVYLVRAGLFNDVDAVLHWHPGDGNGVTTGPTKANISAKFRFTGVASHASAAPERGRSALDGVESMDYMVNMMREHVPQDVRIHYVITRGGEAPNVVPAFAESYYYVRHRDRRIVREVFERVTQAAKGAAMGTGTSVSWEITGGVHDLLPNEALAKVAQANLERVGGFSYDESEKRFAAELGRTFIGGRTAAVELARAIQPLKIDPNGEGGGSTDVGDVSYVVPTVGVRTATWVPGTPAHSWQAAACGATTICVKGRLMASKALALTAMDLFSEPKVLSEARAELLRRRGEDFKYEPLLGDRAPALNYRD